MKVINLPWLNNIDSDWLAESVEGSRLVVTIDNHYLEGGQGERIKNKLLSLGAGSGVKAVSLGITGIAECGRNTEVLKAHKLDAQSISEMIYGALKG